MRRNLVPSATAFAIAVAVALPVAALTVEQQVTPEYLKAHSKELALKVERRDDGMIHFTLKRTLTQPKYFVARLVLKQDGKKVADVSTPSFGKKDQNRFYVALSPSQLEGAEYLLSESFVSGPTPLPGTTIYKFNLADLAK